MGKEEYRNDYRARAVYATRGTQTMAREDKFISSKPVTVAFDSSFDRFSANVAFMLRDKIPSQQARGLMRASVDLKLIHDAYMRSSSRPASGTKIGLKASLFRRRDGAKRHHWIMIVRFRAPDWEFKDEGTGPLPHPNVVAKRWHDTMTELVDRAVFAALRIDGEQGKRIRKWVGLADDRGYPRSGTLWYYDRALLEEYYDNRTDNARRRTMTQHTQGEVPFNGDVSFNFASKGKTGSGQWRLYPFRRLTQMCMVRDASQCQRLLVSELIRVDDVIFRSLDFINSDAANASAAVSGGLVERFVRHLRKLQNSPDHMYSAYK